MARINIHIELDTRVDTLETLVTIAHAFGGKVTLEPKVVTPAEPKMNDPETKIEEPKIEESKKGKKVTKPAEIKTGEIVDLGQKVPNVTEEELPKTIVEETKKDSKKEPEPTIDDVRKALADAKRSGKSNEVLKGILKDHDAEGVSQLDPKHYKSVIDAVKAL